MLETRVLDLLDQLLVKTRFGQFPFLPSYWLFQQCYQWAEGVLNVAGFFLLVLLSHVAFFGFLASPRLGNVFYETASAVQSRASAWANGNGSAPGPAAGRRLPILPARSSALQTSCSGRAGMFARF